MDNQTEDRIVFELKQLNYRVRLYLDREREDASRHAAMIAGQWRWMTRAAWLVAACGVTLTAIRGWEAWA
jgi:hypothetical protein